MTTTRRCKIQTTTSYPQFITIKTIRTIHTRTSNGTTNPDKHDDYYEHGSVLSKFKCKAFFSKHFGRILIVIFALITFADMVHAGTCWAKRTQSGKCKHPMERNVSREKCCGGGNDVGFMEKEMTEFEFFFSLALGDGTACSSCIDSCKTAKCGTHKKCVMRSGQPKCVCAPNCKTKKLRPKRVGNRHAHSQLKSTNYRVNKKKQEQQRPSSNHSGKISQHHHHRNTSHGDIQIFDNVTDNLNIKSDKIISIIAPISHLSNLSNSHRFKKNHNIAQMPNGNSTQSRHLILSSSNNSAMRQHHQTGINHRHKITTHKNQYSNSSLIDNNIVNVNHRRQTSVEQQFQSKFYGHDIPYPPIDLPLYDNNQVHRAVCGTDGKTYKTECQLKRRACRQESTSLSVAYKGQCQTSCKYVQCQVGQHCLEDQNLMPHCVTCSIICPPYDPAMKSVVSNPATLVCGIDGHTYRNLCEIKRTACMLGRSIPVAYRGACKESANCDSIKCKNRQACLSDLVTHRPRCVSCSFKCPRRKRPQGQQSAFIKICGMNNKSYHSWCHMLRDSCNTGYYIDIKHNGVCQNSTKT